MISAKQKQPSEWVELEVQRIVKDKILPSDQLFKQWADCIFAIENEIELSKKPGASPVKKSGQKPYQITLRIVDQEEGRKLNEQWRHKEGATNVLSFSMSGLDLIAPEMLGDIVICAPVVKREAEKQSKVLHAHWAHMLIHGVLHLLGYDHNENNEAEIMEYLETRILQDLGYPDPY